MFKAPLFFNLHHHHFAPKDGCLQDFSSYLLFEATGDSEADAASSADPGGSSATPGSPEFNDAESCTDDTPDCDEFVLDVDEDDDGAGEEEENYEKNDEVVESKAKGFTKSSASIDSTKEFKMLNEVDKNRLFWEACLAS